MVTITTYVSDVGLTVQNSAAEEADQSLQQEPVTTG